MAGGFICAGCQNRFIQDPRCITCGARVLDNNTVREQAVLIERLRASLDMSEARFATLKTAWDRERRRSVQIVASTGPLPVDAVWELLNTFGNLPRDAIHDDLHAAYMRVADGIAENEANQVPTIAHGERIEHLDLPGPGGAMASGVVERLETAHRRMMEDRQPLFMPTACADAISRIRTLEAMLAELLDHVLLCERELDLFHGLGRDAGSGISEVACRAKRTLEDGR